ncbi:PREDICTED: putative tripartite motif-containing protein 75 [Nanorana parkeri]|uniref:putative tripartite motif-containing protein 75 n=1 Tax=Nanorana parkeri TaxID=125878 RepID=UPI000854FC7E|nr:PREDICTED: putative tripartite motif-containing protein 75 [Nanorana parkeri]
MDIISEIQEKLCSMCHDFCTDRVLLPCEHIYCRRCMEQVLNVQDHWTIYYCMECYKPCQVRPLIKQEVTEPSPCTEQISCTYCDVPAIKTCVQCDSLFCATHLMKHPSLPGLLLVEPSLSLDERKCSTHKEILKYYCREEGSCICMSCWAVGDHQGHQVTALHEFVEQKKSNLRPMIERFEGDLNESEKQICRLIAYERDENQKADAVIKKVMAQIEDLKTELSARHTKVLGVISKQKKMVSLSVSNQIKKLETNKSELSRRMKRITELCEVEDPLTFLKDEKESNMAWNFSGRWKTKSCIKIDETSISQKLHKRLLQFADGLIDRMLKEDFPKMKKSMITLDKKTAHYSIIKTYGLRRAFYSSKRQKEESNEERFKSRHVLSKCSFSGGNHYWEVDVVGKKRCFIGVACHSMDRKTISSKSLIGFNNRSWSLGVDDVLAAYHNCVQREIPTDSPVRSFGIFLEYKVGRLSFYQLCHPIRHLHTFTATFTEPLHAAFYLDKGSSITIQE